MGPAAASATASRTLQRAGDPLRIAFAGPQVWLDGCAPSEARNGLETARFALGVGGGEPRASLEAIAASQPHVTVVFDPPSLDAESLQQLPGVTLGVLVGGAPAGAATEVLDRFDRLISFEPSLSGARLGRNEVWRAIPPPVSDQLFADVRPLRSAPQAISVGRSSEHREAMLVPAKHHHNLIQILSGVSGRTLIELLGECDVGVFVPADQGGGFGLQVGMHLAGGQLLLAEELRPLHGLERNIDYLNFHSPDELVWVLDRLARFPEMHHRIRVRGRLKAEQYRASRLFARIVHDLLRDVAAFGSARMS